MALSGVGLRVGHGEVVGLLGPNGAGKSTAVKILLGLVRPSAGQAQLFGLPSSDPAARRTVGYLPELFRFPAWMTGRDLLRFHGRLAGLDRAALERQLPTLLADVGMAERADRRIGTYSKGMAQRVGLAQAMLGSPQLVVLDEPTSALDPVGRREVRELILGLKRRGVAVLLNSHLLTEVEHVCDRVVVLDRGRVVFDGRLSDLTGGPARVEVQVDAIDGALVQHLSIIGDVEVLDGATLRVAVAAPERAADVAAAVVAAGRRLYALRPTGATLEDVFVGMVRGGDR
jgi:ABC-2 type transport system ATP-binding protein